LEAMSHYWVRQTVHTLCTHVRAGCGLATPHAQWRAHRTPSPLNTGHVFTSNTGHVFTNWFGYALQCGIHCMNSYLDALHGLYVNYCSRPVSWLASHACMRYINLQEYQYGRYVPYVPPHWRSPLLLDAECMTPQIYKSISR